MEKTEFLTPFGIEFNLAQGAMLDYEERVVRRASDLRTYYRDDDALEQLIAEGNDPLLYEVFEKDIPESYGHLRVVVSKLQPGKVGDEFFMTKGHYHTVSGTAEVYLCLRGAGYMLMKTMDGHSHEERMVPERLIYVPPHWAHRTVNTGDEPLISLCVYPGEAGHNYGDIKEQGFPQRVVEKDGSAVIEHS